MQLQRSQTNLHTHAYTHTTHTKTNKYRYHLVLLFSFRTATCASASFRSCFCSTEAGDGRADQLCAVLRMPGRGLAVYGGKRYEEKNTGGEEKKGRVVTEVF